MEAIQDFRNALKDLSNLKDVRKDFGDAANFLGRVEVKDAVKYTCKLCCKMTLSVL